MKHRLYVVPDKLYAMDNKYYIIHGYTTHKCTLKYANCAFKMSPD